MSVIIKRDRDGSTAIDPRCIGTVIVRPLAAAATPFGDNNSAVLVIVDDFGLSPDVCHWSTILNRIPTTELEQNCTRRTVFLRLQFSILSIYQNVKKKKIHTKHAENCPNFCDCFLRNRNQLPRFKSNTLHLKPLA